MYTQILMVAIITMNFPYAMLTPTFNCKLPFGCEIKDVQFVINYSGSEKTSMRYPGILCDIRNETFQFNYSMSMESPLLIPDSKNWCHVSSSRKTKYDILEFRFPSNFILSKRFNFQKMSEYTWYFKQDIDINFVNLKGFELDIITTDQNISTHNFTHSYFLFQCIRCKIEFYSNGRHMKTCQDILNSDPNFIVMSLFQILPLNYLSQIILFHSEFKTTVCPLVFKNSHLEEFYVIGLADTFYKRNILTIENSTFDDLNSEINYLSIEKAEKINIDFNLLNPSVFQDLVTIYLSGSFNKIDGNSLNALKQLSIIQIVKRNYRDIIHKNGIKWIRDLNADVYVNLTNIINVEELKENYEISTHIKIGFFDSKTEMRLSKLFPDEDFCLYKDFPFNQLVILMEHIDKDIVKEKLTLLNSTIHYTCSYLWLAQYFHLFLKLEK